MGCKWTTHQLTVQGENASLIPTIHGGYVVDWLCILRYPDICGFDVTMFIDLNGGIVNQK
jgi:hypothetical protein